MFGNFKAWLFGERFYRSDAVVRGAFEPFELNVAVARVRSGRLDAEGDQLLGIPGEFQTERGDFNKPRFIEDQVISGCHNHRGIGLVAGLRGDPMVCVGDARGCVAHERFAQHVFRRQCGEVFADQTAVALLGDDEDVVGRDELGQSVVGHLDQRPAGAEDVQELLGPSGAAHGPKPRAHTPRHDHGVGVLLCVGHCVRSVAKGAATALASALFS